MDSSRGLWNALNSAGGVLLLGLLILLAMTLAPGDILRRRPARQTEESDADLDYERLAVRTFRKRAQAGRLSAQDGPRAGAGLDGRVAPALPVVSLQDAGTGHDDAA